MRNNKHNEYDAVVSLTKKNDVKINGTSIFVLKGDSNRSSHDVGIGSWGKIDYLVKKHRYNQLFVDSF